MPIPWPNGMTRDGIAKNVPPRKTLGQHFLYDPKILERIALSTGAIESETVIEVGPGPGGLTKQLLNAGAKPVIAVEADRRFVRYLKAWPEAISGDLRVIEGDATKLDWDAVIDEHCPRKRAKVISNLPYNVGTVLLVEWLKASNWRTDMALLLQYEVAMRICASPSGKHYGRLSVIAQAVTDPKIPFKLAPGAFRPPPKVESALVVLTPLSETQKFADLSTLEAVTAHAFGQRRKMLKSSLARLADQYGLNINDWLQSAGIDGALRPEALSQADFQKLASTIKV